MAKKCETYPPILSKETYDKELAMCKELNKSSKCCWGNCKDCGVIPLLYKLHTGQIIHGEELEKLKKKIFESK